MKIAWIAVAGEDARVKHALERLDVIGDTFLSVGSPAQHALRAGSRRDPWQKKP